MLTLLLPHAVVLARGGNLIITRHSTANIKFGSNLDYDLLINGSHVEVCIRHHDPTSTVRPDPVPQPHLYQFLDLFLYPPLKEVIIKLRKKKRHVRMFINEM